MTSWTMIMAMSMIFIMAIQSVMKKVKPTSEKWAQFECGFTLMNPVRIPFSFQFFLISILFLIFDVEISMILSYPLETTSTKNTGIIYIFIMILTIGLIYEWQKSKIDWNKWMESFTCIE